MRVGTTVARNRSRRRGGTCPVPLGRVLAGVGAGAASPFRGWALVAGPRGAFWAGAVALSAIALPLVHRLAAALAHADLAPVGEHVDAGAHRPITPPAHQQHVGQRQRALPLDDAALAQPLGGALVPLDPVDLFDQDPALLRQHAQHLAALAALPAGDDRDRIPPTDVGASHQITSGASEMILVNCRSRSSRATGPKMRVPTGFSSGLMSTTAFRSKQIGRA